MAAEFTQDLYFSRKENQHKYVLDTLKRSFQESVRNLGEDHPNTIKAQFQLTIILQQQCFYDEAMHHAKEVYRKILLKCGDDPPQTWAVQSIRALILVKQKKYAEAFGVYKDVHDNQVLLLGSFHDETLITWNNMTSVRAMQGDDVLPIFERIYNMLKEVNPTNRATLVTRFHIAVHLSIQEKYNEALEVLKEIKSVHDKTRPILHDTLSCLELTGAVLLKLDMHKDSLEVWEKVLKTKVQIFGTFHPQTLRTLAIVSEIGTCLANQKQFGEKLVFLDEVYSRRNEVLGPTHPETLIMQEKIASMLFELGTYDNALIMYQAIYEIKKRIYLPDIPNIWTTRMNIVATMSRLGKYDEALSICEDINELLKNLSPDNPRVLKTQISIANLFILQNKIDEGLKMYSKVVKIQEAASHFGPEHPQTLATWCDMALILKQHGKIDDALKIYTKVLEVSKRLNDAGSLEGLTPKILKHISSIQSLQGNLVEAINSYSLLYTIERRNKSEDHPDVIAVERNIAKILLRQGQMVQALEIFRLVHRKRLSVLGNAHPDTLISQRDLQSIVQLMT